MQPFDNFVSYVLQLTHCCTKWWVYPCRVKRMIRITLQWRHNGGDGVSNHQPHDWLLNRLFMRRSTKTPKLRVTGLCEGNSPVTGEFPAQRASYAENVSIWWRHHEQRLKIYLANVFRRVKFRFIMGTVCGHSSPNGVWIRHHKSLPGCIEITHMTCMCFCVR